MSTAREHDEELCYYTLAHADPRFIHQHVVDAHQAQSADGRTKPITLTFSPTGLYLHCERELTGRQVQRAHMELARGARSWPLLPLPAERGAITVAEVVRAAAGTERDALIHAWCVSLWSAFAVCRPPLIQWLQSRGYTQPRALIRSAHPYKRPPHAPRAHRISPRRHGSPAARNAPTPALRSAA